MFKDKVVCITGGSGFLGKSLAKYFAKNPPKKLIILSRNWQNQNELKNELNNPPYMRFINGDVYKKEDLLSAFKNVDIVIHAAAIKDLQACQYNTFASVDTNVIGTMNVVKSAIERKVNKTLLISTDKAVNPINTYGKCKSLAEDLILFGNTLGADEDIKFSVCRYGNVVNSSGSVIPVWKKMIENGAKYLPITDEECTRFWFPVNDAVDFVVDCISKMQGREIFIPELPSVRIVDICKVLNMPYKVVGLREGEKIHEQMDYDSNSGNNPWFLTVDEIREGMG